MSKRGGGKSAFSGVFTAILLGFILLPVPASAQEADWRKNFRLDKHHADPVGQKLTAWLYVTETSIPAGLEDMKRFVLENPDWPKLHAFRARIELSDATAALPPAEIASWFDRNPPESAKGLNTYMTALLSLGLEERARAALKKFWLTADLNKRDTAALAKQHRRLFSPTDHADRLDNLLWEQRYQEAEHMLPLVDPGIRKLGEARIALGRISSEASRKTDAVPMELQNDGGLIFNRVKWRRQKDKDDEAFEMLQSLPPNQGHADLWWKERNILARRAIEKKDYLRAYKIAAPHGMTAGSGPGYSEAEWLLGWLALEYLRQPDRAYRHFDRFYQAVNSAVSRARAAYWLARSAEAMRKHTDARNWYTLGAQFPSTFYGQISHEKVFGPVTPQQFLDEQATPETIRAFEGRELVRAIRLLSGFGLKRHTTPFFIKLLEDSQTRPDFVLTAKLAREMKHPYFSVEANKQAQQRLGLILFTEGYPLLPAPYPRAPEKALIHAIVQRESMFDPAARSNAGARGLMQLMPGTAKQVSRSIGQKYSVTKLTDNPKYNVELGAAYLQDMLEDYNGFYPLAIAAYNAGPGNVNKWIRQFGDPRSGKIDLLNWIELIPIYETRNYVHRVMEAYYIYKLRFDEKPRTVLAFRRR